MKSIKFNQLFSSINCKVTQIYQFIINIIFQDQFGLVSVDAIALSKLTWLIITCRIWCVQNGFDIMCKFWFLHFSWRRKAKS